MPTLVNWSRTQRHTAELHRPADTEAVAAVVKRARERGTTVRCVGALHSWSDVALGQDLALTLDAQPRNLRIEQGVAHIPAGMRLHELNEALATQGHALSILGSVTQQSVAGAVATGTHGSSLAHGNIASALRGMTLVTGTGEALRLEGDDPRLDAARVSLGALGIATELSIAVEPAFRLREVTEPMPWDRALADLPALARSAEYVKLWWLPHTEHVIVFRCERTEQPGATSNLGRWLDERVVNQGLFAGLLRLGAAVPALIPHLNRLVASTYMSPRTAVDRSDRVLAIAMPPVHREVEHALPVEHAGAALQRLRDLIEREGLRVNFVVEARFVKGDGGWLSPAHGRDTCQLGAYMAQAPGIERYFAAFEEAMDGLDSRPHWGKETSWTAERIGPRYPRWAEFQALARELDPDGVFRSPATRRLLGS